jgi:hypothetical protein
MTDPTLEAVAPADEGSSPAHDTTVDERRSWRERGASLVEYALLLSLIAIACIGAITLMAGETADGPRGINRSASSIISAGGG